MVTCLTNTDRTGRPRITNNVWPMEQDEIILVMKPSQWLNFGWFLVGIVGGIILIPLGPVALIPILIYLWKVIELSCWKYEFWGEMIIEKKGVFNVIRREVHYYRIKSLLLEEPLLYRLVGIGNLHVKTSDKFNQDFTFVAVDNCEQLRQILRTIVQEHRDEKGVKEFDLYDL